MKSAIQAKAWIVDFFHTFAAMNWTIIIIETIVLTLAVVLKTIL